MIKHTLFLVFTFLSFSIQAQAPFSFNYQGLARNVDGDPLSNQDISLLVSVIGGFENGIIEFQEEHVTTTDDFGQFAIRIGEGTFLLGNLRNIDWGRDTYFLRIEMDPEGGEDYIDLGTTQLHSVPYALFAAEAGNASGGSGSDEQTLALNGNTLSIENGNSVNLSSLRDGVMDDDADPENEIQTLSISENVLSISGGNEVLLPAGGGAGTDNQILSLSGKSLTISNGNTIDLSPISNDADADPGNELQSLSIVGDQLSISGGNSITLPDGGGGGGTDNQTLSFSNNNLSITNGNAISLASLIDDNDADPENELQTLSLANNQLSISGGNSITLDGNSPWEDEGVGIRYNGSYVNLRNGDMTNAVSLSRFNNGSGGIDIFGDTAPRVEMFTTVDDGGLIRSLGANGNLNLLFSTIASDANKGWVGIYNENGENRAAMFVSSSGRGGFSTNGANGNGNVDITALGANVNHGFVSVKDADGDTQAGIYVDADGNGRVFADFVDTFVDNPDKSGSQVTYSVMQGPESGAYLRGTASMVDGSGKIDFPAHFQALMEDESMTVMITPLSADSKGIAVISKSKKGFVVKELLQGKGNYEFDWEVKVRRHRALSPGVQPAETLNETAKVIAPQKSHG